jgi:hypothetical protein
MADLNLSAGKEAHVESAPTWIESDVASDPTAGCNPRKSPSVFGGLVAIALRSVEPGTHQHGKANSIWAVECARREAERAAFDEWLNLSLAQKWADLEVYTAWSASDVRATFEQWLSPERLRRMMPPDALEAERRLFLGDLDVLRQLSLEGP